MFLQNTFADYAQQMHTQSFRHVHAPKKPNWTSQTTQVAVGLCETRCTLVVVVITRPVHGLFTAARNNWFHTVEGLSAYRQASKQEKHIGISLQSFVQLTEVYVLSLRPSNEENKKNEESNSEGVKNKA